MSTKRLYKATEAAQVLGIGRTKVYELIGSGALQSVLIGSARRVPADSLDAYIDSLRVAS